MSITFMSRAERMKIIAKSMIGGVFEWYQFCIYGYFASRIGNIFFSAETLSHSLLLAYGIFFAGYLARPIGGIFFSYIGDRYGRKKVIVWTLFLMGLPTFCIGLLPGYEKWGLFSPLCLIICRIIQGLSMGGNYGGALTYIFEYSDPRQKGLTASFSVISILVGLLCASLTLVIFDAVFTEQQLHNFAFRIPFLLGFFVCLWAWYLNKTLPETPVFSKNSTNNSLKDNPLKILLTSHLKPFLLLVSIVILHDLSFYILFFYMMTFFTDIMGLSKQFVFIVNALCLVIMGASVLGAAWYSDRMGRKKIMQIAALFFIVGTIPFLWGLMTYSHWLIYFMGNCIFAVAAGMFLGPLPALMVETFPSIIRNSGITMTGNISGPVFGGSAPLILTYLTHVTHINLIPAFYLTLAAVVAFFGLKFLNPCYTESE